MIEHRPPLAELLQADTPTVTAVTADWETGEFDRFGRGYPRPQLVRDRWLSLNGAWDFAIAVDDLCTLPGEVQWSSAINVPFAPEAPASGIGDTSFYRVCWYRRTITFADSQPETRLLLHFGAVDHSANVCMRGPFAG